MSRHNHSWSGPAMLYGSDPTLVRDESVEYRARKKGKMQFFRFFLQHLFSNSCYCTALHPPSLPSSLAPPTSMQPPSKSKSKSPFRKFKKLFSSSPSSSSSSSSAASAGMTEASSPSSSIITTRGRRRGRRTFEDPMDPSRLNHNPLFRVRQNNKLFL